jgi:hypothetical protein
MSPVELTRAIASSRDTNSADPVTLTTVAVTAVFAPTVTDTLSADSVSRGLPGSVVPLSHAAVAKTKITKSFLSISTQ